MRPAFTRKQMPKTNETSAVRTSAPAKQGLYDPQFEHDACGLGFVVNMKGKKSHQMVSDALQILVNLIRNAKYACDEGGHAEKIITLRIEATAGGKVRLAVQDNGIGIPAENLTRIFAHGFTTRKTGHGFGLHSSANAAKEMHGTLIGESEGTGKGATFTLELPAASNDAVISGV